MMTFQKILENYGGFTYNFEDGSEMWSREEMSTEELMEYKEYMDYMSEEYIAFDTEEEYYNLVTPRINWNF